MSKARVWDGFSSKVSSVSSIFSSHFHLSSALCRRPGCHYSKLFSRQVRGRSKKKRPWQKRKKKRGCGKKRTAPPKIRNQGKKGGHGKKKGRGKLVQFHNYFSRSCLRKTRDQFFRLFKRRSEIRLSSKGAEMHIFTHRPGFNIEPSPFRGYSP